MKKGSTVRDWVQKTLSTMTAAQHELILFVLHKDHRIKAGQEVLPKDVPRIEQAVKQVLGTGAGIKLSARDPLANLRPL